DDHLPVELLGGRLPLRRAHQLLEKSVGSAEPTGDVIDPRGVVELMADQPREVGIGPRLALPEERWLPGAGRFHEYLSTARFPSSKRPRPRRRRRCLESGSGGGALRRPLVRRADRVVLVIWRLLR